MNLKSCTDFLSHFNKRVLNMGLSKLFLCNGQRCTSQLFCLELAAQFQTKGQINSVKVKAKFRVCYGAHGMPLFRDPVVHRIPSPRDTG